MTPSRAAFALAVLLSSFAVSGAVLADVAGPHKECEVEGMGCASCFHNFRDTSDATAAAFASCREAAVARGLVEACSQGELNGDQIYFCPAGKKPERVMKGGGCAGCAVGSGAVSGALAGLAVGIGMLALRRGMRRSGRKTR